MMFDSGKAEAKEAKMLASEARDRAIATEAKQSGHEQLCTERWNTVNLKMDGVHRRMDKADEWRDSRQKSDDSFRTKLMLMVICSLVTALGAILLQIAIHKGLL